MCPCEFESECTWCVCGKGSWWLCGGAQLGEREVGKEEGGISLSQLVKQPQAVSSSDSVGKFQMATLRVTFVLLGCDGMLSLFGSIRTTAQKQVTCLELCASTSDTLIGSVDRGYWKDSGEMDASQMVWTFTYSEGQGHCASSVPGIFEVLPHLLSQ